MWPYSFATKKLLDIEGLHQERPATYGPRRPVLKPRIDIFCWNLARERHIKVQNGPRVKIVAHPWSKWYASYLLSFDFLQGILSTLGVRSTELKRMTHTLLHIDQKVVEGVDLETATNFSILDVSRKAMIATSLHVDGKQVQAVGSNPEQVVENLKNDCHKILLNLTFKSGFCCIFTRGNC